jgi:MoaA/NifB/PqqE/SkfB family radical SAM enzyme
MSVKAIQIGLTSRCNSNCFFCFREELKRRGWDKGKIDLSFDLIERAVNTETVTHIQICGNTGEALFHPDIEKIIDLIKSKNLVLSINTNGSWFDSKWWFELGKKMMGDEDRVIFALDGLKYAHEFYRRTDWNNVFNNMKSFIKGGGHAIWQMILFEHNQHQISLVKALAKIIGCKETWIINSRQYNEKYKKPTIDFNKTKREMVEDMTSKNINIDIDCGFFYGERVYLATDGEVWPCCHTRCHYGFEFFHPLFEIEKIKRKEEREFINLRNNDLNYIVENSKLFKLVFDLIKSPYDFKKPFDKQSNRTCLIYCNREIYGRNRRIIINNV